jgi:hypothetical protein
MSRQLGIGMREFKEGIANPFRDDEPKRPEMERGPARVESPVDSARKEHVPR